MKSETRQCQNCHQNFTIEPDDFGFYEKIKVPPPTFCPDCRLLRRFMHTSETVLYKRKCDFSGKEIFSMYSENTIFPVYETDIWYSDAWDPYEYGMDFDENRPFLEQFLELQNKIPRMSIVRQGKAVNSPYAHRVTDPKNSYMVFRSSYPEDSMYLYNGKMHIKDCCDGSWLYECELCYECVNCANCYNVKFSQESKDSRDCSFIYSCRNCSNCVGCVNLVSAEYCIWNKKYTKQEYFEKLKEMKLNTFSGIEKMKIEFENFRKKFPQRAIMSIKSEKVSGNWFLNSKNVTKSFDCEGVKDGKYLFMVFNAEDCMDYFEWGNKAEQIYETENSGIDIARLSFCNQCWRGSHDLWYCHSCQGSHNCFGCMGLKKGEYSILNKKYTKGEYEKLVPQIIEQMKTMPYTDNRGLEYRFGENFPASFSDFGYNETIANYYHPLTKEEAQEKGYRWADRLKNNYQVTLKASELPEMIGEVNDSILDEVIECAEKDHPNSVGAYRITQNELNFYRRMDLPLPRVCFDIRHIRRMNKRPPLKIIKRHCSQCGVEVETVYTEEYAPIVYCESCYQKEVY
ncbi:MAG: hypothetical protein AAB500_01085 [Patescibacteria group bacterium]